MGNHFVPVTVLGTRNAVKTQADTFLAVLDLTKKIKEEIKMFKLT